MARSVYGASGAAQVVSLLGAPTVAAATVKSARTGGVTVTDILDMSGGALAGIVTPDASGQVIFQGPDSYTTPLWLDFGTGPRWAVHPVDLNVQVETLDSRIDTLEKFDLSKYGASTGASDNSAALTAAIAAMPTNGGVITVPAGQYFFTAGVSIPAGKKVTIVGESGQTSSVPRCSFTYTGGGGGSFITVNSANGVTFRDIGINYTSTAFTGRLLDLRNISGNDSAYWMVDRCSIGGIGVATGTAVGIALNQAIDGTIRNCHLYLCNYAIDGYVTGDYVNGIILEGTVFHTSETAHVHNIGQGWTIAGNVFEGLRNGGAGAIINDSSILTEGTIITGNWFGDVTPGVGGNQISAQMHGVQITGNYLGANTGCTTINVHGSSTGFIITGNRFRNGDVAINLGTLCTGYNIGQNSYSNVTTERGGSLTSGAVRSIVASVSVPMEVWKNSSNTDGRCTARFQADRTSIHQYDIGIDPTGGATKAFALRDNTNGANRWKVPAAGGFVVGDAVLATSATDGFLYVPTCAGTPTGGPNTQTGTCAVVYDTSANKLWVYNGGWKSATFS